MCFFPLDSGVHVDFSLTISVQMMPDAQEMPKNVKWKKNEWLVLFPICWIFWPTRCCILQLSVLSLLGPGKSGMFAHPR